MNTNEPSIGTVVLEINLEFLRKTGLVFDAKTVANA